MFNTRYPDFFDDIEINYDWCDYLDIEIENKAEEYDLDDEYRVEFLDLVEASYGYNW